MTKTRYKISESDSPYFITCTVVDWLPVLTRDNIASILIENLVFMTTHNRLMIFAYVIMPSHIHMIVNAPLLSAQISRFKSYIARRIIDLLISEDDKRLLSIFQHAKPDYKADSTYRFWQPGCHPKQIYSTEVMNQKIIYIHQNPVRKNLVENPEDWKYSSISNYLTGEGLVNVATDWWW